MRSAIILVIITITLASSIMAWHFSAGQTAKRQLRATLEELSLAANSQDKAALFAKLDQHLTDNAQVNLNVQFSVFSRGGGRGWIEDHDKQGFKLFLEEMIGKVDGYGMTFTLEDITLAEDDPTQFTATVAARGFGAGASLMMGKSVGTRYVISSDCIVTGTTGEAIQVSSMDCPTTLSQQADLKGGALRDNLKALQGIKP